VAGANIVAALVGGIVVAQMYFLVLYLQEVSGESPLHAALLTLPIPFAAFVSTVSSARLAGRFGARNVLIVVPLFGVVGHLWWSRLGPGDPYVTAILLPVLVATVGSACCFVPMTLTATRTVAVADHGLASGLLNAFRQVGAAVVLAALATIAASRTTALIGQGVGQADALARGYDRGLVLCAVGSLLITLTAALIVPPDRAGREVAATRNREVALEVAGDRRL
jgi:hypothetical protein